MNTSDLNPKDFVRMFANKTLPFFLSDLFLSYYKKLGVVSTLDREKGWISFLPKAAQEEALLEGAELYHTPHVYRKYADEFRAYMEESARELETMLNQVVLTATDVQKFLTTVIRHWSYYAKTEFFHTDDIDSEKMVPSIEEFDKLKLDGRAHLNTLLFEDEGYVRRLVTRISKETNVSERELLVYSITELLDLLTKGTRVDADDLRARDCYFATPEGVLFGESAEASVHAFQSPYLERTTTITGRTAYPGKITARACVLAPDFSDFGKTTEAVARMQLGEVLVAETTSPDIIIACKKASAIITTQGGTLSHAAIVARELKIPCIIGTDVDVVLNITSGDLLEVDADAGVIRILESGS
jgi:phosphohistidine swiveling domain-containing protein